MKRIVLKVRKGTTMMETIICLVLLSLAVIVMTRLTTVKLNEQAAIDSQYSVLCVDAYLSDIYHDFHSAASCNVTNDSVTGNCRIVFDMGAEKGPVIYEFDNATQRCYKNGTDQFSCTKMEARGAYNNLYVAIKLPGEHTLDIDIFR